MANKKKNLIILMAEDDQDDQLLTEEALEENDMPTSLYIVENGEELMDYLNQVAPYNDDAKFPRPNLILLDLNMPKKDGREALKEIKADPKLRQIPIVALTTSQAEDDIYRSYDLGVSSYITKPVTFGALVTVMQVLSQYWFETVELPPVKRAKPWE